MSETQGKTIYNNNAVPLQQQMSIDFRGQKVGLYLRNILRGDETYAF